VMRMHRSLCVGLALCLLPAPAVAQTLQAAVLPNSRSVMTTTPATAFATVINAGRIPALGCRIGAPVTVPAQFTYQTTQRFTNVLVGTPNTPVDIPAGASQTFVVVFQPRFAFEPLSVPFTFVCTNTPPAAIISGVNTLLLSASSSPVLDVVALSATPNNDGIVNVAQTAGGVFSVATINVGATDQVNVSADTGNVSLPLSILLCQTNPVTGQCVTSLFQTLTGTMVGGFTFTFAVFVNASSPIEFLPAINRVFVRFKDAAGFTRGSTSVAVQSVSPAITDIGHEN